MAQEHAPNPALPTVSATGDAAPAPAPPPLPVTEIRVHGINRASDFSSLGTALRARRSTRSDLVQPVLPVGHDLRLFNWSETNRRLTGPLWAAALPFTLANVAGHMGWHSGRVPADRGRDVDPGGDAWVQGAVLVHGLLLSCTALVWLLAILEVVPRALPDALGDDPGWRPALALSACLLLVVPMGFRVLRRRGTPGAWRFVGIAAANAAAVLGLAGALLSRPLCDPAQPACGEVELPLWGRTDVLTASIVVGHAVVLALAAVLLLRAWSLAVRRPGGVTGRIGATAVGAAVALIAGWALLVGIGSALRIGLEWAVRALEPLLPAGLLRDADDASPLGARASAMVHPPTLDTETLALPNGILVLDTLGALAFLLVAAALALVLHRADRARREVPDDERGPGWPWRLLHHAIGRVPTILPVATIAGVATWTVLIWTLGPLWATKAPSDPTLGARWLSLATVGIALVAFFFAVTLGRWQRVRGAVDVLADVVGFFPIEWHPLAGLSYRRTVLDELLAATDGIDGPIVYSGHSQGSVIGLWFLHHDAGRARDDGTTRDLGRYALVTSGSPIRSLYATLFPRFFDDAMIAATLGAVHSWTNVWRATDPIATPLASGPSVVPDPHERAEATIVDVRSIDPPSGDREAPDEHFGRPAHRALWHTDYWIDHRVRAAIVAQVASLRAR